MKNVHQRIRFHIHELWIVFFLAILFYAASFLFLPAAHRSPKMLFLIAFSLLVGYCVTLPVNWVLFRSVRKSLTLTISEESEETLLTLRRSLYLLPLRRLLWVEQRMVMAGIVLMVVLTTVHELRTLPSIIFMFITVFAGLSGGLIVFFSTERMLAPLHALFHGRIEAQNIEINYGKGLSLFLRLFASIISVMGLAIFLLGSIALWLTSEDYQKANSASIDPGIIHLSIVILFLIVTSVLITLFLGRNMTDSISHLMSLFTRASRGDLMTRATVTTTDELGNMTQKFNHMMQELSDIFGKVRHVSDSVTLVAERLSSSSLAMSEGVEMQATSTDTTASSMAQMQSSISEVADSVNVLFEETEKTSVSIIEMASSIEQVAINIESLSQSVDSTSSSIEEMNASIKHVAENSIILNRLSLDLYRSTDEIIRSINEVEKWAIESSKLSNNVTVDADRGHQAVLQTVEGMEKIHKFFQTSGEVIQKLGDRSEQIGNILNVIDDVASQTNLLALNAAIISAQAGEHGKEFSVVADEIRDLAEKAARSTKEINVLIKGVQEESAKAVQTMEEGARLVAEGVKLSHRAGDTLKMIIRSSSESAKMTTLIEETTIEQVSRSREISKTVDQLRLMSNQIAKATKEQKIGISQIMRESENVREMAQQVQSATEKQTNESRAISKAVSEVNEMVERIRIATSQQKTESMSILEAVEIFKDITLKNVDSMVEMDKAVDTLASQVRSLENQVSQFQV